ncbi:MAG TPA: cytochrome c [Flavobacteriaceae bacterium]|nr:cytochrome c [Flavobacteriaceae bacterium]
MKKQSLFLTSLLFVGGLVLTSMTIVRTNQEKPWVAPKKYQKLENPVANAKDEERIGRILYIKHCKSCHGNKGHGDGTKAASLDTKVPDFASDAFKKDTDGSLFYKTTFGREDMPSFEKKIPDDADRWWVVNYIKTLAK